jgi:hypothetical protein
MDLYTLNGRYGEAVVGYRRRAGVISLDASERQNTTWAVHAGCAAFLQACGKLSEQYRDIRGPWGPGSAYEVDPA